jgi:hypothetical protein
LHPGLEQELNTLLGVVSLAQKAFGGERAAAIPPRFAPRCDLEDDVGRGHFAESSTRSRVGR